MMVEQRHAVLIGSSVFPDEPTIQPLRLPENDVDGFKEILTSGVHGLFWDTDVLKNRPSYEVLRRVNQVLGRAERDDLVLIYYSGHGKLNRAGHLHLATVDTTLDALESTSIPVQIIKNLLDVTRSSKAVLILDCCYSGAAGAAFARSGVDDQLQLVSSGRGTYILTASTGIQVALENEADQYGVFTKHIIEGIRRGDADRNSDGLITMEEIYVYVRDKVREEGVQEPMKWDLNVSGSDLVIARSGNIRREERRNQLREMLFRLARQRVLPDRILSESLQVIARNLDQLSEEQKRQDALLEELLAENITVGDFIHTWYEMSAASQTLEGPPKIETPEARPQPESVPPVNRPRAEPGASEKAPQHRELAQPVSSFRGAYVAAQEIRYPVLQTTIVWGVGWGIAWAMWSRLGGGYLSTEGITAGLFPGAIIGLITGLILQRSEPSFQWTQVSMVAAGWAIAGIVLSIAMLSYWPSVSLGLTVTVSGIIGGLLTGLALLWMPLPSMREIPASTLVMNKVKLVLPVTIGWIVSWSIAWGIGLSLVDWLYYEFGARDWTITFWMVGTIAGVICGAVGSGVMYWQLSRMCRNS